jgi:hypothetical protein
MAPPEPKGIILKSVCLSTHQAGTRVILTFVIAGFIDHNMVIIFYILGTFFLPSVISIDYSSVASYVEHLTTTTLSHASVLLVDGQDSLTNTVMDKSDQIRFISLLTYTRQMVRIFINTCVA